MAPPTRIAIIGLLCCLWITMSFCASIKTAEKSPNKRIVRQTQNIPSNKFKPLDAYEETSDDEGYSNTNSSGNNQRDFTRFSQQSTGRARTIGGSPTRFNNNNDFSDESVNFNVRLPPGFQGQTTRTFRTGPIRVPINNDVIPLSISSYAPPGNSFRSSNVYPYPTGFRSSGFGDSSPSSSSGNFYRSESYSFSSDGMGPPRIEQSVFDSRHPF